MSEQDFERLGTVLTDKGEPMESWTSKGYCWAREEIKRLRAVKDHLFLHDGQHAITATGYDLLMESNNEKSAS